MEPKPRLTLTLHTSRGEDLRICVDLTASEARDVEYLRPPKRQFLPMFATIDDVVEVLRAKVFRKDRFIAAAANLGALLAERMEDAEGWHDESRIEPAKRALRE